MICLFLVVVGLLFSLSSLANTVSRHYTCLDDGRCRLNDALASVPVSGQQSLSQDVCLMGCGTGHLWPYPSGEVTFPLPQNLPNSIQYLSTMGIKLSFASMPSTAVSSLAEVMKQNFWAVVTAKDRRRFFRNPDVEGTIHINVKLQDYDTVRADYHNDESYSLEISKQSSNADKKDVDISISAKSIFGYRHALESLSQLISFDSDKSAFAILTDVSIMDDKPAFPYRGIMIDVSRNFISVEKLKENIRAASFNKMNVVHLHLSDTPSIPLSLPREPNMTYFGAYSPKAVYSTKDIEELVEFANVYGIMLIPEIDAPAHMGAGWQWGSKEAGFADDMVICHDTNGYGKFTDWATHSLEPPGGQLNLANPAALDVLGNIYHDVLDQFQYPSVFHLGGDEVIVGSDASSQGCYNDSTMATSILQYLEDNGWSRQDPQSFYALWGNFTLRATDMVEKLYKSQSKSGDEKAHKLHIWGGGGVDESGGIYNMFSLSNVRDYLPPNLFTVQVWDSSEGSIVPSLIQQGYEVVLSHTDYVYLDCGNSGFVNAGGYWCQPYHEWYHLYNYVYDVYQLYVSGTESKREALLTPEEFYRGILGSETLIWTEMVDDVSVSQKLWPRSAALAEALWTNPHANSKYQQKLTSLRQAGKVANVAATDNTLWYEAADRMLHWRQLLVERGVAAEALQPTWCLQRESGYCSRPSGTPQ